MPSRSCTTSASARSPATTGRFEQLTGGEPLFPVHELALVYMGMLLGENFELDALAEACAATGRWDFFFAGQPLPIRGGVGGPVNPIAVL